MGTKCRCKEKGRIEGLTARPTHTYTILITAKTEFKFVAEDNPILSDRSPISSNVTLLQTEARDVRITGSPRNWCYGNKCHSASHFTRIWTDTGTPTKVLHVSGCFSMQQMALCVS